MADELNLEAEHLAFEAAMRSQFGGDETFERDEQDCYENRSWHDAFIGWLAARRAAPIAAQLDAELPPLPQPAYYDRVTARMSGGGIGFTADQMRDYACQVRAPHAERIRLLERELAGRRQPAGSIGNDSEFNSLIVQLLDADHAEREGKDNSYLSIRRALVAYIDGRTASTAVPEDAKDAAQWREILRYVVVEMSSRFTRGDGNAPGHGHSAPGIWDGDNGVLAGKECTWCKVWNTAVDALAAAPSLSGTEAANGN
jgi:hypothetical protein